MVKRVTETSGIDPILLQAATEVDRSLLVEALSRTPRERLRVCSRAAKTLAGFIRVPAKDR